MEQGSGLTSRVSKKLAGLPAHVGSPDPSIYWSDNYVTLDFETTTRLKGSPLDVGNRIVLACWRIAGKDYSTFGSEYDQGELVRAVEKAQFIIAHNSKFELGWLRRCGVDLRKVVVYDTMIGEYIIGGNRFNLVMLGLNACLRRYGLPPKEDIVGKMLKAGIDTADIPESWLLKYCKRDVEACEELFLQQRESLMSRGLIHLQYQRCLVAPALADMEFSGMQLDASIVEASIKETEDQYAKSTAYLQNYMDGTPPSSNQQKCVYVYDTLKFKIPRDHKGKPILTKSGGPSVAADTLDRLRPVTEKQREWLRLHKEWVTLHGDVTKYLRKFELCCEESGGLLKAVFNQCIARTHRLTSSGFEFKVQFQNLNKLFKPVFKARKEGWLVGEADGAQLEFRIAAHMGRDKQALKDIIEGKDIHRFSASELLEIPEEAVSGRQRQEAKEHTFKPLYGGRSGTPAQQRYYQAFAEKYKQIARTQKGWTHKVLDDKRLRTEYGLLFYWPGCAMTNSGYILYTTNIYNYPVQGFATAEIIPIALVCAWHRMADMESFLVNTVHDSIIAELHPKEIHLWHEIAQQCLIRDCYNVLRTLYKVNLTVPLGAGVMVGTHWANEEAKKGEVVYEAPLELYEEAARKEGML